ncbi:probable elongation factor 1-delta isoform X1 [Anopheles albimanus]|uniref:probable elongation factor 1-delta isoform X1 n=1 Tax=Anopheles albimanus TaxID=7167 RepID=UPI00163EF0B3|nr:probable elongation factor 1-delta isoform X1 [Anopheles albimanus]
MAATALPNTKAWYDRSAIANAETKYYEYLSKLPNADKKGEQQDGADGDLVDAAKPKIEQPKKSNAASQRSSPSQQQQSAETANVAAVEPTPATDAPKAKKDKKKRNKGKKESTPTDNESSERSVSVVSAPLPVSEPTPAVVQADPEPEVQKEPGKKKSKKSKKSKSHDADPEQAAPVVAAEPIKDNKYEETVHQQNVKNQKEKENLAHKLCDNIAEELNKINSVPSQCTLASEISKARQHIKNSLERMDGIAALAASPGAELLDRLSSVEKENEKLRSIIDGLNNLVIDLHERVKSLESGKVAPAAKPAAGAAKPAPAAAPAKKAAANDEEDDDDVDLFGSDDEDEDDAAAQLREKRLAEYAAKKSKKPALIAKSNVILDIKPWDDETDMKQMEAEVRKISADGLLLGAAKLVPLAYGIHKLQMSCVIEDDKISVDWLQEEIEKIEDFVQSVDIAAFNKI